jgi:hypothetical protein
MTIAVEAGELEQFVPESLRNLAAPPVFTLRPASGRDWRRYQKLLRSEGLAYHDQAEFRRAALEALKSLWSPEVYETEAARLQSYWELLEQGGEPDPDTNAAVTDLIERLSRADKKLSRLAADNGEFLEESMRIAASMFVVGWTGLDAPYSREEGMVPLETLDVVEQKLFDAEKKAMEDKVVGVAVTGVAWLQLCNACQSRLRVTQDEEKNSSSPPPPPSDRSGSKTRRSRKAASSSKASASSEAPTQA